MSDRDKPPPCSTHQSVVYRRATSLTSRRTSGATRCPRWGKGFPRHQLSHHCFSRLTVDPAGMTDIPAASRERLVNELMPQLSCATPTAPPSASPAKPAAAWPALLRHRPSRLTRNLSTAEIVDQVRLAAAASRDGDLGSPPDCPTWSSWAWASHCQRTYNYLGLLFAQLSEQPDLSPRRRAARRRPRSLGRGYRGRCTSRPELAHGERTLVRPVSGSRPTGCPGLGSTGSG
jgi:hypothetical protein